MNNIAAGVDNTIPSKTTPPKTPPSKPPYGYDQHGRRIYTKAQRDAIYAEFAKRHPQNGTKMPLDITELPTRDQMDTIADELFGKSYSPPTDPQKMTYNDYINAWENKDWKTTQTYSNAVKSGTIPQPQVTTAQMMRFSDINMQNTPGVVKNILAFMPGLSSGLTMGTDRAMSKQSNNPTTIAYNHTVDNLKNSASAGYGLGEDTGKVLGSIGLSYLFGSPGVSTSAGTYLQNMAPWGASAGLETLVNETNEGKSKDQIISDTLKNAAIGVLTGGMMKYLGEVMPQVGSIAYQKMVDSGGLTKILAPVVARISAALNPEGAEAATGFRLGKEAEGGYNSTVSFLNPKNVRTSQSSVNDLDEIVTSMNKNGWLGDPIDVVRMEDGNLTALDNTRTVAANISGIKVNANVHDAYEKLPDALVERFSNRYGVPKTWGDAVLLRIRKQSTTFRELYPLGAFSYNYKK